MSFKTEIHLFFRYKVAIFMKKCISWEQNYNKCEIVDAKSSTLKKAHKMQIHNILNSWVIVLIN
jgi:hypothetical protein